MIGHRNLLGAMCLVWIALGPNTALWAQSEAPPPKAAASSDGEGNGGGGSGLSMNDIEGLVAPIALYPDVLISQILPASTFPTEIVMAARWIADHPDLEGLDDQKWDPSVLSVCRYASVLDKMNTDLDWTNALGATFLNQPDDVFGAIQTLRQQAKDADILKDTPQQQVVEDEGAIRIVPAEEQVIYVPQYNPQIIYVDDDDDDEAALAAGIIGFGAGLAMGAWLDNDCDWHHHTVYACRPGYWGGWAYHGHVNWDNDWYAVRGPQRGFVRGPNGGAAWGPNGRAVWGSHGGVWARPSGYAARPAYTGRYAGSGNFSGNRRTNVSGNTFNRNNVNVNVDRGDRTNIQGGNRANVRGGDRAGVSNRQSTRRYDDQRRSSQVNRSGDRGAQSRRTAASRPNSTVSQSNTRRSSSSRQRSTYGSSSRSRQSSAYGSNRSSRQVQRSSSRGSSSRGRSGGRRGGGGGRRR